MMLLAKGLGEQEDMDPALAGESPVRTASHQLHARV